MVQLGNLHVGKAETAKPPGVTVTEAAVVWDLLSARYKCIEETGVYHNYAHDVDFKKMIEQMGMTLLRGQVEQLEKQCEMYAIPMPGRPPKLMTQKADIASFSDEFMFRQIFEGCQHFLERLATCIATSVHNDGLRMMFVDFFQGELSIFNKLCKYGKLKGWLDLPPPYQTH